MLRNCGIVVLLLLTSATFGCGRQETHERYVPAADAARSAIDAALEDWRDGKPPGLIERLKPPARVVDTHRKQGQLLKSFEILGEVPAEATRCFAVRVTLDNPAAELRIRYAVVGIDPLWVFRQEDLEKLAHWEHTMPAPDEANGRKGVTKALSEETAERQVNDSDLRGDPPLDREQPATPAQPEPRE